MSDEQIFPVPSGPAKRKRQLTEDERQMLKDMEVSPEAMALRSQHKGPSDSANFHGLIGNLGPPLPASEMARIKAEAEQWRQEALAEHEKTYGEPYRVPQRKKRGK